jgi:hypothetical protein
MPVPLDAFLPYVEPHVPGAPVPGMLFEIRNAAIAFCARSRAWKSMDTDSVAAGVAEYPIPAPPKANVVVVEAVFCDGQPLQPETLDGLRARWTNWITATGTPLCYTQLEPDVLILVPRPVAARVQGLTIRACYQPTRDADTLPDFLLNQYAEVIGRGAAARVLQTPGEPYTNPQKSMFYYQQFEEGVNRAATKAARGFTRAPLRTRPRFL